MRYTFKKEPRPNVGDTKLITKFLWFPKIKFNDNGEEELRWLEKASYKICYSNNKLKFDGERSYQSTGWIEFFRWENN